MDFGIKMDMSLRYCINLLNRYKMVTSFHNQIGINKSILVRYKGWCFMSIRNISWEFNYLISVFYVQNNEINSL